jgi:hypothetical protein
MLRNQSAASSASPRFQEEWRHDLASAPLSVEWLWSGYLAAGHTTLLTSPWKAGKTTLTSLLLQRLLNGGELAGQAVRPGKAVVVSEESRLQWRRRVEHLDLGPHICWLCRPFRGRPTPEGWQALIDYVDDLRQRHGLALLVIDPWAAFLPGLVENDAGLMLSVLQPLQQLTTAGLAVLLLHHPRKKGGADGQWARGSGALSGFVDVVIEMRYFSAASADDRRRVMLAYSRFEETPRRRVIELNAAGTEYQSLGDLEEEAFGRAWEVLQAVLQGAQKKLTRPEIIATWPATEPAPIDMTLYRWLERAIGQGRVERDGRGRKCDPYRYWLPERVAEWQKQDFLGPAKRQADEDLVRELMPEEDE